MKAEDFELLSRIVKERSGLALKPEKVYLLETRLPAVAKKFGAADIGGLLAMMRRAPQAAIERAITEAMTTNETFFFRDTKPFDQFRTKTLPALLASRADKKHLRIWCAASSTGQEPYSLAMILAEARAQIAGWKVDILATDISLEMVERAKAGIYSQFEVQRGLPVQMLARYFTKLDEQWQIKPEMRTAVRYQPFNLLDDPHLLGQFDVIFCRNVLIYFDLPIKRKVLDRMAAMLPADGSLFLGAAETVIGVCEKLEPMPGERGLYRPRTALRKAAA